MGTVCYPQTGATTAVYWVIALRAVQTSDITTAQGPASRQSGRQDLRNVVGKGDFDAQAAQTFANVQAVLMFTGAPYPRTRCSSSTAWCARNS